MIKSKYLILKIIFRSSGQNMSSEEGDEAGRIVAGPGMFIFDLSKLKRDILKILTFLLPILLTFLDSISQFV